MAKELYLLGPPTASIVDPRLWGFGRRPSHQPVVRDLDRVDDTSRGPSRPSPQPFSGRQTGYLG